MLDPHFLSPSTLDADGDVEFVEGLVDVVGGDEGDGVDGAPEGEPYPFPYCRTATFLGITIPAYTTDVQSKEKSERRRKDILKGAG